MIPVAEKSRRLSIHRNRGGFLLGSTWSHHRSFEERRTHFYLGWWVLTLTTKNAHIDGTDVVTQDRWAAESEFLAPEHSDGTVIEKGN